MANHPKCLLLPIDKSPESLRPVEFLSRLYNGVRGLNLILSYFLPPLAPIYREASAESHQMIEKRREVLGSRERETRDIFQNARKILLDAGFSPDDIQEHIEQKQMTVAKHACLLADIRQVDAIVVPKRVSSNLEGFLKGDSPASLLQHCLASPIWFTEGDIDAGRAAICISSEDAALHIADHAGYMLANTSCSITLLHAAKSVSTTVKSTLPEMESALAGWSRTSQGQEKMPYLRKAAEILSVNGVEKDRISISIIPSRNTVANEILSWCASNGISIIGLGHSEPEGVWSFLRASVTKQILSDFKNMAVWVTQ